MKTKTNKKVGSKLVRLDTDVYNICINDKKLINKKDNVYDYSISDIVKKYQESYKPFNILSKSCLVKIDNDLYSKCIEELNVLNMIDKCRKWTLSDLFREYHNIYVKNKNTKKNNCEEEEEEDTTIHWCTY